MAILNKTKRPYLVDDENNIFIGLDLPIRKGTAGDGYFASTKTTIEAVKNNIISLLMTETGERLFQPTLGLNLKIYMYQNYSKVLEDEIKQSIIQKFKFWLPFVDVTGLVIGMNRVDAIGKNQIDIRCNFIINKDPNTTESVSVSIK